MEEVLDLVYGGEGPSGVPNDKEKKKKTERTHKRYEMTTRREDLLFLIQNKLKHCIVFGWCRGRVSYTIVADRVSSTSCGSITIYLGPRVDGLRSWKNNPTSWRPAPVSSCDFYMCLRLPEVVGVLVVVAVPFVIDSWIIYNPRYGRTKYM